MKKRTTNGKRFRRTKLTTRKKRRKTSRVGEGTDLVFKHPSYLRIIGLDLFRYSRMNFERN